MKKYRPIFVVAILILNIGSLFFTITLGVTPILNDRSPPMLRGDSLIISEKSIPPPILPMGDENPLNSQEKKFNPKDYEPRFSVQQQTDVLLNETLDEGIPSFTFKNKIWASLLGTDSYDPSLYENGSIDPSNTAGDVDGTSLFTRIGNRGNNESTADKTLLDDIANISAGWQINFPIQNDYEIINISFKWRFDALNGAFDNYDVLGELILDATPDYQEIRCRIKHPAGEDQSFWIGNPVTNKNPNGTVFYRVGLNVVQDEVWNTFEYSFQVDSEPTNFTLELGAFLNTREYWNEYFDVWFDDILILGIDDIPDNHPPQAIATGLDRTANITQFEFWANFSEGTWETPIKNVTVVYNQSGISYNRINLNSNLDFHPPAYVNEAGYNQTHWQFLATFNFSDNISYYFVVYDSANNSYVSETQSTTIGDYTAPEITSTIINQTGTGLIIISVNVSDWGDGVDTISLNYTIDGIVQNPINIHGEGTDYQANFIINISQYYESTIEFGISLNDTVVGNSDFRPGNKIVSEYPIVAAADEILPVIHDFDITASSTTEGRANVTVFAEDPFGKIDEVFLVVNHKNGTIHEDYSHVTLRNTSVDGLYILSKIAGEAALRLQFDPNENYSITAFVRDNADPSNQVNFTKYYVVPDILPPRVSTQIDLEYFLPGQLRVWIQASDLGSGIKTVTLEVKSKNDWINYTTMKYSSTKQQYYTDINTGWFGNERIEFRINAVDNENNIILEGNRPTTSYTTKLFFTTILGLIITEVLLVTAIIGIFATIKIIQLQQLKAIRRKRFDLALDRSERLAYLGEEAMFGFIAAYGQSEGVSSMLLWEPRLIGYFHQYLKELIDKANNNVAFIMRAKAQDLISYVDFNIEEIGCSAITFAYPASSLPQQWLAALTLDQVPIGAGQGVLLLLLVMREKWSEISHNFQDEIADGMLELKDLILSGEDKEIILQKSREFRLFISGTLEVLDEIETDTDEISDDIMGDFETELSDIPDEDSLQDETDDNETSDDDYRF